MKDESGRFLAIPENPPSEDSKGRALENRMGIINFVKLTNKVFEMKKEVKTDKAPGAIGPYSQAVMAGGLIFVSGQLPINPSNGEMPDDIKEQTRQSLENVKSILEAIGASMHDVAKSTVYLADMSLFGPMNEVYGEYFQGGIFPARAAFAVKELPKGAKVEIEVIAENPSK